MYQTQLKSQIHQAARNKVVKINNKNQINHSLIVLTHLILITFSIMRLLLITIIIKYLLLKITFSLSTNLIKE